MRFFLTARTRSQSHTQSLGLFPPPTQCCLNSLPSPLSTRDGLLCAETQGSFSHSCSQGPHCFLTFFLLMFQSLLVTREPVQHPCIHGWGPKNLLSILAYMAGDPGTCPVPLPTWLGTQEPAQCPCPHGRSFHCPPPDTICLEGTPLPWPQGCLAWGHIESFGHVVRC